MVPFPLRPVDTSCQRLSEQLRLPYHQGLRVLQARHDTAPNSLWSHHLLLCTFCYVPPEVPQRPAKMSRCNTIRPSSPCWRHWNPRPSQYPSTIAYWMLLRTFCFLKYSSFETANSRTLAHSLLHRLLCNVHVTDHRQHRRLHETHNRQRHLLHLLLRRQHHWALRLQILRSSPLPLWHHCHHRRLLRRDLDLTVLFALLELAQQG